MNEQNKEYVLETIRRLIENKAVIRFEEFDDGMLATAVFAGNWHSALQVNGNEEVLLTFVNQFLDPAISAIEKAIEKDKVVKKVT